MTTDWEAELRDVDFGALGDPPTFAERLAEEPRFAAVAGGLVLSWNKITAERRNEALALLGYVALDALPDATAADAQAVAQAVLLGLQHQAGAAFAAGDLPLDGLRQIVGATIVAQPTPKKRRALRYPVEYYADALRLKLLPWARRWWPGLASDFDANYDRLLQRRKRARRTARRCLDEADQP